MYGFLVKKKSMLYYMFNYTLFFVIVILFIFFIGVQIYYYRQNLLKNKEKIERIEKFKSSIGDYVLDDESLKRLLSNYDELLN
jgi:cell division protein FtsL